MIVKLPFGDDTSAAGQAGTSIGSSAGGFLKNLIFGPQATPAPAASPQAPASSGGGILGMPKTILIVSSGVLLGGVLLFFLMRGRRVRSVSGYRRGRRVRR